MNTYDIRETYDLIRLTETIKPPANYLLDTLFPNKEQSMRDVIPIEYSRSARRLAPYVVRGGRGLNVSREGSKILLYRAPMIGARRIITSDEISQRMIGEQPIISSLSPADRAAQMQARDLVELQRMIQNRKAQMASELLQTGKITVKGYADDGTLAETDEVTFESSGLRQKNWTATTATILDDLQSFSEEIQEVTGMVPTLLICGSNAVKLMAKNKEMREWLLSANVNALSWLNFKPQYTSPQVRHIGYIGALNLEMVSYNETYLDDDGQVKPFIEPNNIILCNPGRGRQLYGAVTYLDSGGQWHSAAAESVPVYNFSTQTQSTALTVYSRVLLCPLDSFDFICANVQG